MFKNENALFVEGEVVGFRYDFIKDSIFRFKDNLSDTLTIEKVGRSYYDNTKNMYLLKGMFEQLWIPEDWIIKLTQNNNGEK